MTGAGASFDQGISKSTPAEWDTQVPRQICSSCSTDASQFRVNVVSQVFLTIALIPLLSQSSEKRVVNVASMLGDIGYTLDNPHLNFASYSATKGAITIANAKFHNE